MASDTITTAKYFQKCGDITVKVEFHKKMYALNCIFCGQICLQLDAFVLHIESYHTEQLYTTLQMTTKQENNICEYFENSRVETTLIYGDPLDEPPLSVLPADLLSVVDVKEEASFEIAAMGMEAKECEENKMDAEAERFEEYNDKTDLRDSNGVTESEEQTEDQESDTDCRELTLAIIAGYEKQRILWDVSEPLAKSRKKCDEALRKITTTINKKLGTRLKSLAIKQRIRKMRYKFRSELQNQQQADCKGESYTPIWYYEKLAFLNTTIKYKRRNKRGTKALANEKSALPLHNLTDAQNRQLIDIYKSFPCLWDVQHIGFRFKNQRQDAIEEMLHAIKSKINLEFNQDDLQKKLYRIRYACTQEKHRKLRCERQEEAYKPVCKYYKEISFLEDNVGPFKCTFCEQTLNGVDQYKIHKSKHDGSMPFICPLCKRGFMKVGNCTVHLRRHTGDYPFACKVCGKRYATSTDVNVHMRCHTGDKPYFCEICGQSFRTWTFFDAHMRRHQKRPSHKCTICSKAFYENNKLTEHMKAHLNIRDKVCNVCGKAFTSSKYLRQHRQIHAEKKKYSCKICGKNFAQYAGLSGHMKSHGTTLSGVVVDEQL